ncbi:MAG: trigger factor [Desulfobulbaceae bacterium]|jgi:trigger factor|nr:trigger factor [Desulfobulbaceae bacterium]
MQVSIQSTGVLGRSITITLPAAEVSPKLKAEYENVRQNARMAGFRKGKVPMAVIEKNYKPQIEADLAEKLIQESYFDAIDKEDIDPVTHPDVTDFKYNPDGSFTYEAAVEIRPVFTLAEYKGIEVERPVITISDEEVAAEMEKLRRELASLRDAGDRPAQEGDVVVIDFQGYFKGNPIKQLKNSDFSLELGSGKLDLELEKKLVGLKKGEETRHTLDYPESHPNPFLQGRNIEFHIKLKELKERLLPEIDDEFAKDVSKTFNTLDDLKFSIRERRMKDRLEQSEGAFVDKMMETLLARHDFEVPKRLVDFEVRQMVKETEDRLKKLGITPEKAGMDLKRLAENSQKMAVQRVRGDFILKKIAEVESIKVDDADMERGFKRIGDQYRMSVAEVKEFFKSRDDLLPLMNELLNEKILNFLKGAAAIKDAGAAPVEPPAEPPTEPPMELPPATSSEGGQ